MSLDGIAGHALAWLATYALHSTALLGSVWLLARSLGAHRVRLREKLWKFAVLAGIGTSLLQVGCGWTPYGGQWSLREGAQRAAHQAASDPAQPLANRSPFTGPEHTQLGTPPAHVHPPSSPRFDWASFALAGWLWGGVVAAVAGIALVGRLRRQLRRRRAVEGPLRELLEELCARTGQRRPVRLSFVDSLDVPISWGWLRGEICIPPRVESELGRDEQRALLAHELAHLLRRDPAWMCVLRAIEGLFFFQPLHRIARREIEDCAEFQCDAWAVRQIGSELSLARCLTQVAGWVVGDDASFPAPAMARGRSRLVQRVQRLWDPACRDVAGATRAPWSLPLAALATVVFAFVVPGVSARSFPSPHVGPDPRLAPLAQSARVGADARSTQIETLVAALDLELRRLALEYRLLENEARELGLHARLEPLANSLHQLEAQRALLEAMLSKGALRSRAPRISVHPSIPE